MRSPAHPFRWMLAVALAGSVVARLLVGPLTIDDAFITFRYSEHLASGLGFVYNAPDHVLGTSTPLFALLMAVPAWLGLDLQVSAFVVSVLSDVVSLAVIAALLRRRGYTLAPVVAVVLVGLAPSVLIYSVSGMETSLYVALVLSTVWAVDTGRWGLAAVCAALAALCRPEGALMAAGVGVAALLTVTRAHAVRVVLFMVAVVTPWLIFATVYFGSPIPMSVLAKADMVRDPLAGFRVVRFAFFSGADLWLTLAAAGGCVLLWRSKSVGLRLWVAWGMLYAAAFTITGAFDNYLWYFTPLMPLVLAACAVVIDGALTRVVPGTLERRPTVQRTVLTAAVLIVCVAVSVSRLRAEVRATEDSFVGREALYKSVASALTAQETEGGPPCGLAGQEIGVLGYYYDGPIVDIVGLVSPEFIGRPRGDVLRESRACWLVTYDNNLQALDPELLTAEWFAREFQLIDRRVVSPTRALLIYRRR